MSKKVAALLLIVSLFAISCTAAQDAGAQPEVNTAEPYEWVLTALRDNGTAVEALSTISQPFFEPEARSSRLMGRKCNSSPFPMKPKPRQRQLPLMPAAAQWGPPCFPGWPRPISSNLAISLSFMWGTPRQSLPPCRACWDRKSLVAAQHNLPCRLWLK